MGVDGRATLLNKLDEPKHLKMLKYLSKVLSPDMSILMKIIGGF